MDGLLPMLELSHGWVITDVGIESWMGYYIPILRKYDF